MSPQSSGAAFNIGGTRDKSDESILFRHVISGKELLVRLSPAGMGPADIDFDTGGLIEFALDDIDLCMG